MKRQGLILWSTATLLIGGYALYDYQQAHKEPDEKVGLLASSDPEQVTRFSIISGEHQIEVMKVGDQWKMLKPVEDRANQVASTDFLRGVTTERFLDLVKEGEDIDWSAFGLDKPKGVITLISSGENETFFVGTAKNFEGNAYIRRNTEKKVYVANSTWFAKVDKKVSDFRDQRLMRMSNAKIETLTFEKGKERFELTRKDSLWMDMSRMKIRLDQNKVREVLGMLNLTEALDFISENPVSATELKTWDLAAPALKLTAKGSEGSWVGQFSSGKDKIYRVLTSDPAFVLKLSPVDAQKFLLMDFDSFRDRMEAFQFSRDKAQEATVLLEGASVNINGEKLLALVRGLEKINVTEFISQAPKDMKNNIQLKDAEGKVFYELQWSGPKKSKVAGTETSVVEARSSAVDYAFTVTEQEINSLKLKDIK